MNVICMLITTHFASIIPHRSCIIDSNIILRRQWHLIIYNFNKFHFDMVTFFYRLGVSSWPTTTKWQFIKLYFMHVSNLCRLFLSSSYRFVADNCLLCHHIQFIILHLHCCHLSFASHAGIFLSFNVIFFLLS